MAKRAKISKEVRRTIRLKFLTETGKTHTISLNCASAELAGGDGPMLVKRVMERVLEYDVFTVKLVKALGAELVERRMILTEEDFQADEVRTEAEPEVREEAYGEVREELRKEVHGEEYGGVYKEERAVGASNFKAAAITRQIGAAVKNSQGPSPPHLLQSDIMPC